MGSTAPDSSVEFKIQELRREIRSFALSAGSTFMSVEDLIRDYENFLSQDLEKAVAVCGFASVLEFLKFLHHEGKSIQLFSDKGMIKLHAVSDTKTKHLENLIVRQKSKGTLGKFVASGSGGTPSRAQSSNRNSQSEKCLSSANQGYRRGRRDKSAPANSRVTKVDSNQSCEVSERLVRHGYKSLCVTVTNTAPSYNSQSANRDDRESRAFTRTTLSCNRNPGGLSAQEEAPINNTCSTSKLKSATLVKSVLNPPRTTAGRERAPRFRTHSQNNEAAPTTVGRPSSAKTFGLEHTAAPVGVSRRQQRQSSFSSYKAADDCDDLPRETTQQLLTDVRISNSVRKKLAVVLSSRPHGLDAEKLLEILCQKFGPNWLSDDHACNCDYSTLLGRLNGDILCCSFRNGGVWIWPHPSLLDSYGHRSEHDDRTSPGTVTTDAATSTVCATVDAPSSGEIRDDVCHAEFCATSIASNNAGIESTAFSSEKLDMKDLHRLLEHYPNGLFTSEAISLFMQHFQRSLCNDDAGRLPIVVMNYLDLFDMFYEKNALAEMKIKCATATAAISSIQLTSSPISPVNTIPVTLKAVEKEVDLHVLISTHLWYFLELDQNSAELRNSIGDNVCSLLRGNKQNQMQVFMNQLKQQPHLNQSLLDEIASPATEYTWRTPLDTSTPKAPLSPGSRLLELYEKSAMEDRPTVIPVHVTSVYLLSNFYFVCSGQTTELLATTCKLGEFYAKPAAEKRVHQITDKNVLVPHLPVAVLFAGFYHRGLVLVSPVADDVWVFLVDFGTVVKASMVSLFFIPKTFVTEKPCFATRARLADHCGEAEAEEVSKFLNCVDKGYSLMADITWLEGTEVASPLCVFPDLILSVTLYDTSDPNPENDLCINTVVDKQNIQPDANHIYRFRTSLLNVEFLLHDLVNNVSATNTNRSSPVFDSTLSEALKAPILDDWNDDDWESLENDLKHMSFSFTL